jgi:succinate dehydrogenase/fumarate reductase iron-sulfur protein
MNMNSQAVALKIFRYDPGVDHAPTYQTYQVPWEEGLLLLSAIKYVRLNLDETLAFRDYCCGCGWCTSCVMMVNGKGMRTCLRVLKPGEHLTIEPMRAFPVIKDLVVDFGVAITTADGVFKKMEGTLMKKHEQTQD